MANPNIRRQVGPVEFRRLVAVASACADGPGAAMKLARAWAKRISAHEPIGQDVAFGHVSIEDQRWLAAFAAPAYAQAGGRA